MLFPGPGRSLANALLGLVTEDLAEGRHCLDSAMQYISMRGKGQEAALGRVKILVFSDLFVRKWSLEVTQLSFYLPGLRERCVGGERKKEVLIKTSPFSTESMWYTNRARPHWP